MLVLVKDDMTGAFVYLPRLSGEPAEAVSGVPLEVGAGGVGRYRLAGLSSGVVASLGDEVLVARRAGQLWVTDVLARNPHMTCRIDLSEPPRRRAGGTPHPGLLAALLSQALFTEGAHVQRRGLRGVIARLPFYAEADAGEGQLAGVATRWVSAVLEVVLQASADYLPASSCGLLSVQVLTHPGLATGPVREAGLSVRAGA